MAKANKTPAQSQKLYVGKGSRRAPAVEVFGGRGTGVYFPTLSTVAISAGLTDVLTASTSGLSSNVKLSTPAATTTAAGFVLPPGVDPTSPVAGDCWTVAPVSLSPGGFFSRIGANNYCLNQFQVLANAGQNTVNNSTAVVNLSNMIAGPLQAGLYMAELFLTFTQVTAGAGVRISFGGAGTFTTAFGSMEVSSDSGGLLDVVSMASMSADNLTTATTGGSAVNYIKAVISFRVTVSGATLQIKGAQAVATAANTVFQEGGFFRVTKTGF